MGFVEEWGVREQPARATPTHCLSIKIPEILGEDFYEISEK